MAIVVRFFLLSWVQMFSLLRIRKNRLKRWFISQNEPTATKAEARRPLSGVPGYAQGYQKP
jgi:hypothetical protein